MARAVEKCGGIPKVTRNPEDIIHQSNRIILPGVGSFAQAMQNLTNWGLAAAISHAVKNDRKPLLGVCLGMQLLAHRGAEGGESDGLKLIPAEVKNLIAQAKNERIPHIGWNEVIQQKWSPLLKGIPNNKDFYFVHSFHVACEDKEIVSARTPYCGSFVSVIGMDNVFGTQFHPEKSQKDGFQVIKNFLEL